jgi:hypothetical protein
MTPTKLVGANRIFGAPQDWNEETCGPCDALAVVDTGKILQSAWMPAPEELAALNAGQPVLLTIIGRVHPVVSLGVLAPKEPE